MNAMVASFHFHFLFVFGKIPRIALGFEKFWKVTFAVISFSNGFISEVTQLNTVAFLVVRGKDSICCQISGLLHNVATFSSIAGALCYHFYVKLVGMAASIFSDSFSCKRQLFLEF